MANKEPKTLRGEIHKSLTGDGRKRIDTDIREKTFGKDKKKKEED